MKKNNKFIAFFCAMAMILSMFGSFMIVSAEAEPGMTLESSLSEDGKTITVVAKYVNPDEADPGIRSFNVAINVPDTATAVEGESPLAMTVEGNYDDAAKLYKIAGAGTKGLTSENEVIATITITLSEPLANDFEIALQSGSMMGPGSKGTALKLDKETLPKASSTVAKWIDPDATEMPTETPTPKPSQDRPTPMPTEDTPATDAPAPTREPVVVEKGITLEAKVSDDAKTITVIAKYVNADEEDPGVRSFNVAINVPDTATAVEGESPLAMTVEGNYDDAAKLYKIAGAGTKGLTSDDNVIATITITLSEPLAADFEIALQSGSMMGPGSKGTALKLDKETLPAAFTVASAPSPEPTEAPTPTDKPKSTDVKLSDLITNVPSDLSDDAYILVDVTTKDDKAGVYGVDYVAVDKDGNELTEAEFNNMIWGYTDTSIADVIKNITIKAYETVKSVSATLNDNGVVVDEGEKDVTKSETPTEAPTEAPTDRPTDRPTETPTNRPTQTPTIGGGGGSRGGSAGQIAGGNAVNGGGVTPGLVTGVNFQDLGSVSWAVPAINRLATMGIINGRSETVFDPNATVTRAEFAKMVCIAFGISTNTGNMQTFADVTLSDWFYPYVEAAAAAGVINGISDTEFAPNDLITREQMAAMMYRAITYKNVTIQTGAIRDFSDAWNISEYAVNAVNTLSAAGVINGMEDGTFAPKATATRAQAACIIYQYFQSIGL